MSEAAETIIKYGAIGIIGGATVSVGICLLGIGLAILQERNVQRSSDDD